jgi:hypothetical protein
MRGRLVPGLTSIIRTCTPRPDVVGGGLADNHFAAQLDQVVRNPSGYPVYGDPDEFFAITYPTSGLRQLLSRTFGRVSGNKVEGAEHGVIRSATSFGGGKTHSLMAVYHLAKGARPQNLREFVDPAVLPESCRIAAVVADTLDPENGLLTNGIRTWTIWGELAAQLGPEAYAQLKASDESRTAPGKATWEAIVGGEPTIFIIDEIAHHLRQLTSSGNPDLRRMAQAIPAFLKSLFELAAGNPKVVVIITLATQADAYGRETEELAELMNEGEGEFQGALADTHSLLARTVSVIKPAEDAEIVEILKRRLFAEIDAGAAEEAAEAYKTYYEDLAGRGEIFSGGAEQPSTYGDLIRASYPFHPELVRVLDKRIGSISNFNRARGALKLLAEVVAGVWEDQREVEILNVADVDFRRSAVLSHLTVGIDRPDFEQVARVDFVGPASHAATVDATRFSGHAPYATRACTTVFCHSLELVQTAGASRSDYLLGSLRITDDPTVIGEALAEVERIAWHLAWDGARWRFITEPNANKIIAEEMRNVPNTKVNAELEDLVRRTFPADGSVKSALFPSGAAALPDEPALRLAVLHYDDVWVLASDASTPPPKLAEILDHAGMGGGIRTYRNAVVFLVADEDAKEAMRDRVRAAIAISTLVEEPGRMAAFADEVRKKLKSAHGTVRLEARVAINRCFRHLYFPWADKSTNYLRHVELPPAQQGEAEKPQTKVVVEALRNESKIRETPIGTDYLRSKAWPKDAATVSTRAVADYFWRDHGAQLVLDPTLIRDAVRDGVKNGSWVYYDIQGQRAWTTKDPPPPITVSLESMLYTLDEAKARGILGREVAWEDIDRILKGDVLPAIELRSKLETAIGREPSKSEICGVLARAAEGGRQARVIIVEGPAESSAKPLSPADILTAQFDGLTLIAPGRGIELGLAIDEGDGPRPVEARGVAGVAFQQLLDRLNDIPGAKGVSRLTIGASVEPGEGVRDISLLGKAIGMLPKLDISVDLEMPLEFAGLRHGVDVRLAGPASDYQQVEDQVLALARASSAVAGRLELSVHFAEPAAPGGPDLERIRKVLTDLQPGELYLRADPA